jgi:ftsk/spoiiie family protein
MPIRIIIDDSSTQARAIIKLLKTFNFVKFEDVENNTTLEEIIDPYSFDSLALDPMFREAAEIVVNAQQASTSLLQRKLKLDYKRAGCLIQQLEYAGIITTFKGRKPREVLISNIESLDQLLSGKIK